MEEKPIFNRLVRGFLGFFNCWTGVYRGPMKLKVYSDRIVISVLFFKKTIPISKVKNLKWFYFGFVSWWQIEHSAGGIIKFVSFRALNKNIENDFYAKEFTLALKKAGVVWKEIESL